MNFDTGEGLDMHLWPHLLDAAQEIKIIGKRQVRMNATDHMDLADRFVESLPDLGLDLLNTHLVGERMPFFFAECTKFTEIRADVGIVNVLIIDKKGLVPVLSFSDNIGQIAEGEDIGVVEKRTPIFKAQALFRINLCQNPSQTSLFDICIHGIVRVPQGQKKKPLEARGSGSLGITEGLIEEETKFLSTA